MGEALTPAVGNSCLAIVGSGKLAVDGAGGVGVLAEVDRQQAAFLEGVALMWCFEKSCCRER